MFNFDTTHQTFGNFEVSPFSTAFPVLYKYSHWDFSSETHTHELSPAFYMGDDHDKDQLADLSRLIRYQFQSWDSWLGYLIVPQNLADITQGFFPLPKLWEEGVALTPELEQVKLRIEAALDL